MLRDELHLAWWSACSALGLALGCDYPTAHMIISENIPSATRGKLVLGAFAFQAVGALGGTAGRLFWSCRCFRNSARGAGCTRAPIIPAVLVTIGRFYIVESANWLSARGEIDRGRARGDKDCSCASRNIRRQSSSRRRRRERAPGHGGGFAALFNSENRRATILASVPWFLQDLGTYGIGIFTPTILAAAWARAPTTPAASADLIQQDIFAAKGAALIDIAADRRHPLRRPAGRHRRQDPLQVFGFIGCAVGLFLASLSANFTDGEQLLLIFAGFMLFNFMTNLDRTRRPICWPARCFPTAVRGNGAGFAAAFAKIGAVMTAFLFPSSSTRSARRRSFTCLIVTSLLGAAVTWLFRIETTGVSLDSLSAKAGSAT